MGRDAFPESVQISLAWPVLFQSVRIWDPVTGRCKKWISVSQTTSIMAVSYSNGYVACSYGEYVCLYKVEGPTKLIKKYNEHVKR